MRKLQAQIAYTHRSALSYYVSTRCKLLILVRTV